MALETSATPPLTPPPPGGVVRGLKAMARYLSEDALGGPRVLKLSWVINFQKGGTLPFLLVLMAVTGNFGARACLYAALHGSYGLVWLLKERAFPDPGWDKRITWAGAIFAFVGVLGPYWGAGILVVTGHSPAELSPWTAGGCVFVYALGVVLMVAADAQKFFTLRVRRGLITDGMFARIRHPNYLGEMMLYGAFAWLSEHWFPWVVLAWVWGLVFVPNMLAKEASMARYPAWAAYKARTGMLLPKLRRPALENPSPVAP